MKFLPNIASLVNSHLNRESRYTDVNDLETPVPWSVKEASTSDTMLSAEGTWSRNDDCGSVSNAKSRKVCKRLKGVVDWPSW